MPPKGKKGVPFWISDAQAEDLEKAKEEAEEEYTTNVLGIEVNESGGSTLKKLMAVTVFFSIAYLIGFIFQRAYWIRTAGQVQEAAGNKKDVPAVSVMDICFLFAVVGVLSCVFPKLPFLKQKECIYAYIVTMNCNACHSCCTLLVLVPAFVAVNLFKSMVESEEDKTSSFFSMMSILFFVLSFCGAIYGTVLGLEYITRLHYGLVIFYDEPNRDPHSLEAAMLEDDEDYEEEEA
jgi:hypothetical protein